MTQIYNLDRFNEEHVNLIKYCLANMEWIESYFTEKNRNSERFISNYLNLDMPYLLKYIFKEDKEYTAFCNIDFGNFRGRSCTITGGIIPSMLNSGLGVKYTCFILDYVLNQLKVDEVFARTNLSNKRSKKLLTRIGFKQYSDNRVHFSLVLEKRDFYNQFTKYILNKYQYEKR